MCFTTVIYERNGKEIGNLGLNVLLQAVKDNNKWNDDGYGLRYGSTTIRTLSYYDLIDTVISKRKEIAASKLVHLHLRKSTNKVCEEFVHLWEIGGWTCSHNGILNGTTCMDKNDSLEFFSKCEAALKKDDLKAVKKLLEDESGYGVFLLTKADGSMAMVLSKGKDVHAEQYKGKDSCILAISSDDIDDKLEKNYSFKWKTKEAVKLLFAESEETISFDHIHMDNAYEYYHGKKDDFAVLIDLSNSTVIKEYKMEGSCLKNVNSYQGTAYGITWPDKKGKRKKGRIIVESPISYSEYRGEYA